MNQKFIKPINNVSLCRIINKSRNTNGLINIIQKNGLELIELPIIDKLNEDFTLNIDEQQLEKAITKETKLIMLAHTLGRPFNLEKILPLVKKHNLFLIEDCCDALGSTYKGKPLGRKYTER